MAKRNNDPTSGSDKAEVRVFYAEVKGSNESVQDALRTMLTVAGMGRSSQPARVISDQKANGKAAVLPPQSEVEEVEEASDQVEDAEVLGEEEAAPPNPRKPRGTGKKVDRNAGLSLVANLNFMPDGKQALKEFLAEKKPTNDMETTLALVYYMQHVMAVSKIGPAHVLTAYRESGKQIPIGIQQTIRNVKSRKIWLDYTDAEDVKTTTQGENFVQHKMGKSE
jgi:hypothetical protein